jgi:hypothetical protein
MAIWNIGYRKHVDREYPKTIVTNSQVTIPDGKPMVARKGLVYALLLLIWVIFVFGCTRNSTNEEQMSAMNSDLNELKKLIHLPSDVKRCEWQTGSLASHGGDWWLAAVLEVDIQDIPEFLQGTGSKEAFQTVPGLKLTSSFAALKSFSGVEPTQRDPLLLITETYGVEPYLKSPLLNGRAIRLSTNQILVLLWTN